MTIAYDIDDVTVEFMPALLDFYNSKYNRNLMFKDVFSFGLWEVGIGRTKEESVQIIHDFYNSDFFERMAFVNGAREGILKSSEKNQICFISARYSTVREKTSEFLLEHFPMSKIFYSRSYIDPGKTKAEICKDLEIGVMIEDELNTAIECHEAGIRTLLFDKPWNRSLNGNRKISGELERVHNWEEILEKIKGYGGENGVHS